MKRKTILLVLALSFLLAQTAAADLVTNGGFETGDFTGWTVIPAPVNSVVNVVTNVPHSGSWSAYFGAGPGTDDTVTQTLTTVAGQKYDFSFWLTHNSTNNQNDFSASWDGNMVLNLVNASAFNYTQYSYLVTATGPSTTISFKGLEVPAQWFFDDVKVDAVPLPGTLLLLGVGMARLRMAYKRRKQAVAVA